jgi:hypothetical protein
LTDTSFGLRDLRPQSDKSSLRADMSNLRLWLVYLSALTIGCGRQSEATPLERPQVAPVPAATPPETVEAVKPALEMVPARLADDKVASKAALPAAFTRDDKRVQAAEETLPKDRGSKLVDDFLKPKDAALPLFVTRPRQLPATLLLEKPSLPARTYQGQPPRLVVKAKKPVRPHPVPEDTPLYGERVSPCLPADIHLPAGDLVACPSPNGDEPAALPTLAQRQPDRASLADPTAESSTAAALGAVIPLRTAPAEFRRLNLPEPFENRETVRLRTSPPEDATPAPGR